MIGNFSLSLLYWLAGLVVMSEALNKIERTELFSVDPVLRQRLDALRGGRGPTEFVLNRFRCLGWRLVSLRDRACAVLQSGTWRSRVVDLLKLLGWVLLSAGAGGALINPLLDLYRPAVADVCILTGFAVLIIRARVRESLAS